MDMLDLVDIQRERHPNVNKFFYSSKALKLKSRIDFFLLAKELKKYVSKADIQTSIAPDHNLIYLSLNLPQETSRIPGGFWKFNNTLLEDNEYVEKIKRIYPQLRERYKTVVDIQMLWELLKMEIRSTTISCTKGKRKLLNKRELEIKETLENLDDIICNSDDLQNIDQDLRSFTHCMNAKGKKCCLGRNVVRLKKVKGQPNIFFNLEKRNYNKKTISELELDNGELLTVEKLILQEIESYYKDLYTSKVSATQSDFDQFSQSL